MRYKYVCNKLQVHQCPVRRIIRVRETRICSCGFRGTRVYETYVFPKIIGSQAHFRKVAVHVVGKSGCVLHATTTTTGARLFGEIYSQNQAGLPLKVGILGYLLVELDRFT